MADVKSKRPAFGLARPLSSKSCAGECTQTDHFGVLGYDRQSRSLRLPDYRLHPHPVRFGGLRAERCRRPPSPRRADAKHAVIVTVEDRGFAPAGELRHPVIRAWHRG